MFKLLVILALVCYTGAHVIRQAESDAFGHGNGDDDHLTRIIGGSATTISQFPWSAALLHANSSTYLCGGTIVHQRVIVTAARCIIRGGGRTGIRVRVGSNDWASGGIVPNIWQTIAHPDYDPDTLDNDIGLITLTTHLSYSATIQPAKLPAYQFTLANNSPVQVSGWGRHNNFTEILPNTLYAANIEIMDQATCAANYAPLSNVPNITPNMFCAGTAAGGVGACRGDNGGPLIYLSGETPTLYGIISFGNGCGLQDFPSVYVRVSNYVPWWGSYLRQIETEDKTRN